MNACPQEIARMKPLCQGQHRNSIFWASNGGQNNTSISSFGYLPTRPQSCGFEIYTKPNTANCVNLTCPHLKKINEDGFYGLHFRHLLGIPVVFCPNASVPKKNITLPTVPLCIRASEFAQKYVEFDHFWGTFLTLKKPCSLTVTTRVPL